MRLSSRTWSLISLLMIAGAALCFYLERQIQARRQPAPASVPPAATNASTSSPQFDLLSLTSPPSAGPTAATATASPGTLAADKFPHRLANAKRSMDTWVQTETAVLLDNALIDTALPQPVAIPRHLRSAGDPGSYVVQLRGPLDAAFYAGLRDAGVEFVSYVPNHAALVRASSNQVGQLTADGRVQAVLPYEPYYKVARRVLPMAVRQEALPPGTRLNLVLFPGQRDAVATALDQLRAQVLAESRTPFGPLLTVEPPPDALVALAQLPEVQRIEIAAPRVLLNDLTRLRVGVTTNATVDTVETNYLGLYGKDVTVNINDTGVDQSHPGFTVGRVTTTDTNSFTLVDTNGHGTHVAGTIAGSGALSETVTNAYGSPANALYAGLAPEASLFVLPVDLYDGSLLSDVYLQEAAATNHYFVRGATNALISNNSWAYEGLNEYDSAASSYDAAVRDAMPESSGSQPILYVFGAGNGGFGNDSGGGGGYDTIYSPATAKNVISVGALEQFRYIDAPYFTYLTNTVGTNVVIETITNSPFVTLTDSSDQIASYSSRGNVGIGTEGPNGRFKPDVVAPGSFLISARAKSWELENLWAPDTNLFTVLSNLNEGLGPNYRYESGTSMSAPVVSGTLALVQEFFEQRLQRAFTPALFKALLINGARTVTSGYFFELRNFQNFQGWGLIHLTNSLPEIWDDTASQEDEWPVRFFADPATNVLATGQTHAWDLDLVEDATFVPLRVTLVWTDPPGNSVVATKLVNDLDLVVSNRITGEIYAGNDFPRTTHFTRAVGTNDAPIFDRINNVENAYLEPGFGTNLAIFVRGHRVNVNAVTANTNEVVQDYALVISAGEGLVTNPIVNLSWNSTNSVWQRSERYIVTNGVAHVKVRAGANFQLASTGTNGVLNQWRFFVFTNTFYTNQNISGLTNGSNVAFHTFLPPNLSRPRNGDADIDLYVSTNAGLLDLDSAVVDSSLKSRKRNGDELIVLTNAQLDQVFYIGVKSEDQQASEFSLIVQSTDLPFSDTDEFGNKRLYAYPTRALIPDGSYETPGGVNLFAYDSGSPVDVLRAVAELELDHQNVGDLVGILAQDRDFVTLHNHNRFDGTTNQLWFLRYDDSGSGFWDDSRPSDGPGTLNNFLAHSSADTWTFAISDDTLGRTGAVTRLILRLTPNLLDENGVWGTVLPNQWVYYFVQVPVGAVRLSVQLGSMSPPLPLDLYLRRGDLPTFTEYDKYARISPPGGKLDLTPQDVPPLNAGLYFIGIYNPNSLAVTFFLKYQIDVDLQSVNAASYGPALDHVFLKDDAVTFSPIVVPEDRPLIDVQVGIRVDHPRASDLVFHLISPENERVLLAENRGGTSSRGYGATFITTNVVPQYFDGGPEEQRTTIPVGQNFGTLRIDYQFYTVPDRMTIYYDGARIYDSGVISHTGSFSLMFGPGTATDLVIVMNEGGSIYPSTIWQYTATIVTVRDAFTLFTEQTNLTTLPIKFAEPPFTNSPSLTGGADRLLLREGFEAYAPGLYPSGTTLGFWEVGPGDLIVHGPANFLGVLARPEGGTNFAELTVAAVPSGIATDVSTIVDRLYSTRFWLRRNPLGPSGSPQIAAIYADGVLVDYVIAPTGDWAEQVVHWRAQDRRTLVEIRSASGTGPLIDDIRIFEVAEGEEAFFLPEEDMMEPLEDNTSLGQWTLEIWDNRTGPTVFGPGNTELVNWQLNFVFANTNPPATKLTFCQPGTNTMSVYQQDCLPQTLVVTGSEIQYYIVEVPRLATAATNLLWSLTNVYGSSGDLVLLYSPDGLPTGDYPNDVVVSNRNSVGELLLLSTNFLNTPTNLYPGQRYYLGVANADTNEVNAFQISVAFDRIDPLTIDTAVLTNGIAVTDTITNSIPHTNAIVYYQFVVSTNATHVSFDVDPLAGDVDLMVRKAQPVPDPLPRPQPGSYDYVSRNSGAAEEEVIVTGASEPMPLAPGLWYVGVFNVGGTVAQYSIVAREYTNLVTLTNTVPYTMTLPVTNGLRHFQFVVSTNAPRLRVELQPQSGNPNLYVRKAAPGPSPLTKTLAGYYDYCATNVTGTNAEAVLIGPNSTPVALTNGVWFLGVANASSSPTTFRLVADENPGTGPGPIIDLLDGQARTHTISATDPAEQYYRFPVTATASGVLLELYGLSADSELLVRQGDLPDLVTYTDRAPGTPDAPAQIVVRTNATTVSLAGDWYLWVPRPTAGDLTYTIRATSTAGGMLVSGLDLAVAMTAPPGGGLQFEWNSVEGETYEVRTSTDLINWTVRTTIVATGSRTSYVDLVGPVDPLLFYQIRQVPP